MTRSIHFDISGKTREIIQETYVESTSQRGGLEVNVSRQTNTKVTITLIFERQRRRKVD